MGTKMNGIGALNKAYHMAMAQDDKVIFLGEDVADREGGGVVGMSKGLSTAFGDHRVKSTPISEQAIIGAAIGAAMAGYKPIAEIMLMNFTTVAMDMIHNHAAKLRFMSGGQTSVPITIPTLTGAGHQTAGQHADQLEGWFAHSAGIKVVCPCTPTDYVGLTLSSIFDPDPVIIVNSARTFWVAEEVPDIVEPIPLGKAAISKPGTDVTVVTYSADRNTCMAVAAELEKSDISVEVIDLRTVSPWDKETVFNSVKKTGRLVVVHEAMKAFGPGAEIVATVQEECWDDLKGPVARLGGPYSAVPFTKALEDVFLNSPEEIAEAIKKVAAYK